MAEENKRLAVLVDADNIPAGWAPAIFKEIATFGDATVRRIYGDFASGNLGAWRKTLQEHALIPHHQPAYTKGKNSSDIALVIDAMDLLHSGRVDGFALVSSDSDFTRLASRIREEGLDVIGIGQERTPESLRKACKRFVFLENLAVEEAPSPPQQGAKSKPTPPGPAGPAGPSGKEPNVAGRATLPPSKAVPLILDAMRKEEEEWVSLSAIGSHIHAATPDFDPRTFGHTKLADLLEKAGEFEVERNHPARVRRKSS